MAPELQTAPVAAGARAVAPLRALTACGWLAAADAARATVVSRSSAHEVSLVAAPDGRAAIVKQWPAGAPTGRDLRQELFVYRLGRTVPALAAVLPAAWHLDEGRQLLVLEAIAGGSAPPPHLADAGVADALGRALAAWHAATTETGLWPSPAMGILDMPAAPDVAMTGRALATRRLMQAIVEDARLAGVLRDARAAWRDRCLIHGDLRRENWFALPGESAPRVRVIDWELSGSGDPAWDLATVIVEAAIDGLRTTGVVGVGAAMSALPRLLRAYVAADGLLEPTHEAWRHLWTCAIARVLHVATEWTERQPGNDTSVVEPLVAQAVAWTGDIDRLAGEGSAWAAA
ncbi:hypothetical protein TBR22_A43390 [Luteitalea sp. TBR-22]|uniref:phosphotransferase family protein n=1 Tax=Luteitalea sp. TBR-22 TaxID=2802971 RepID=UPI001AF24D2E|nr:aminoglycoside phosphotransferase family protein [Luteitalea sp. TBR-22]BCS35113.1 hypothetical protein TBR22_A43390 [Luteitalea sp. TBR-22]